MDLLDKYNAKASFFFVGSRLKDYKKQAKNALDRGHLICSHSYYHSKDNVYKDIENFKDDLSLWKNAFKNELGVEPTFFRFPYGSNNVYAYDKKNVNCVARLATKVLKDENIIYFDWNVSSGDGTKTTTSDIIYNNTINGIKNITVPIVLLHEWNENTISVLESILDYGNNNGFSFEVLNENIEAPQFIN